MKNICLTFIFVVLHPILSKSLVSAQEIDIIDFPHKPDITYLKDNWSTGKSFFMQPLEWQNKQWITFGLISVFSSAIYFEDGTIRQNIQDSRTPTSNQIFENLRMFGDWQLLAAMGGTYLYSRFRDEQKLSQAILMSFESLLLAQLQIHIYKFSFRRVRPYMLQGHDRWEGPIFDISDDKLSFPSAHAGVAFSIWTVIARMYSNKWYVPPLAYLLATSVAASRVHDDFHWTSDIFMGGAIGYFTGSYVFEIHGVRKEALLEN